MQSMQTSPRRTGLLHLTFVAALAAAVVLPQITLAVEALLQSQTRALILASPLVAAELTVALGFWIALFGWQLKRLVTRLNWRRQIEITNEKVAVHDDRFFGHQLWAAPLNSYRGIAHHIRASLSGTRHELVLVHPDAGRSVLLMVADHISQAEIARFCQILRLPEVPAREMYERRRPAAAAAQPPQHDKFMLAA